MMPLGYPQRAMSTSFLEKLRSSAAKNRSWLCVGLDPDPERLPEPLRDRPLLEALERFLRAIVEATYDLVCAYKPNSAFYEALGPEGLALLRRLVREIVPGRIPVILDAKRGDVASTARLYARAAFDVVGADAVTVSPYLGFDAVEPFLRYGDRGVFLLCRTSNPGAREFQDLPCDGGPLYQRVAERARAWRAQSRAELGLVAGATYLKELAVVRGIVGEETLLLVPGVGAQGGDLERAARAAANAQGENAILVAARSVLYASGQKDFAEAARREAKRLRASIQRSLA